MKRHATAIWNGALADGKGALTTQSGALDNHGYSFKARFEDESGKSGTNPEELIAAAHSSCYAMQLSALIGEAGGTPVALDVKADVTLRPDDGREGEKPGDRVVDEFEQPFARTGRICGCSGR